MNQLITVTFDGKVLKPETPLNLDKNKKYQIALISELEKEIINEKINPKNNIRNHQGFLNGYAPEDEGLYDEY
jgi:predicted DNA-binding antitoxin AbrB/MazE fold protein